MPPGGPVMRSKADARTVLLRVGFDPEKVEAMLAALPDPFDVEREQPILAGYGITQGDLMDMLGGSP